MTLYLAIGIYAITAVLFLLFLAKSSRIEEEPEMERLSPILRSQKKAGGKNAPVLPTTNVVDDPDASELVHSGR